MLLTDVEPSERDMVEAALSMPYGEKVAKAGGGCQMEDMLL